MAISTEDKSIKELIYMADESFSEVCESANIIAEELEDLYKLPKPVKMLEMVDSAKLLLETMMLEVSTIDDNDAYNLSKEFNSSISGSLDEFVQKTMFIIG